MRRLWICLAFMLAVAACGQANKAGEESFAPAPPPQLAVAEQDARAPTILADRVPPSGAEAGATGASAPGAQPAPELFLAYSYSIGMQLPAEQLTGVMDAHVKACVDAGPRLCQLVGSNRNGDPESYLNGTVSLRGEPNWLRGFMDGVGAQAEAAGGRITSQATSTEDLTRAIVDTEAALRAKTTLRDRLERLLASRPGKLSDLLDVERELARVQTEIDSTQSELAVMRTRVSMSELTLNYESSPRSIRSDTLEPLKVAGAGFLGWIVQGFAAIITLIAMLLPWFLVLGLIGWGLLALRKARGGRLIHRNKDEERAPPPVTVHIEERPGDD